MRRLMLALLLAGCATHGPQPPAVQYGEDECARCHMVVEDPRFAAAWEDRVYDDLGELFEARRENADGNHVWVHDFESQAWVDARAAYYVRDSELKTPMGSGLAAFAQRERAAAYAVRRSSQVQTFGDLDHH